MKTTQDKDQTLLKTTLDEMQSVIGTEVADEESTTCNILIYIDINWFVFPFCSIYCQLLQLSRYS